MARAQIASALVALLDKLAGAVRIAIAAALVGVIGYAVFMFTIDVPMYAGRWQADLASGKELLGLLAGLHDARTHWVVSHDIARWGEEIVWMYFSAAVCSSLALCGIMLVKDGLPRYLTTSASLRLSERRSSARLARGLSGSIPGT
jgi:hypothetical protein